MKRILVALFVFVAMFAVVAPASAQAFCQDGRGEYIGGVYFPSARPGYDRGGYQLCGPADYANIYEHGARRYFDGYGLLDWLPMAGVPYGGMWGRGGRPYLNGYGQPLGPTGKGALIGGALGAGIGIARGGAKGAAAGGLIGLGVGAIVGAVVERRHPQQSNQEVSVQQVPQQTPETSAAQPYPPDYNPVRDGRVAQDVPRPRQATAGQTFRVVNSTKLTVFVWDTFNPGQVYTIGPGRTEKVSRPEGELTGSAWTTTTTGGVEPTDVSIVGDGVKFLVVLKGGE